MPAPANAIDAVIGRLLHVSVTAIAGDRVKPSKPTQDDSLPYVSVFRSSGNEGLNLGEVRRVRQNDIRCDAWARNQKEAQNLLAAIVARLDGWADKPNGVHGCFAQGDANEQTNDDGDQISGQTFSVWFAPQ